MSKIDVQAIVRRGEKLRLAFLEAQAEFQSCKKTYDKAHEAYSEWEVKYGALEKVLAGIEEGST